MLNGLRILEFEALGPAPFAAMHLADLGAEVTVVHRATHDNPSKQPRNLLDRGKRSIVLDLKEAADIAVAKALVQRSDALIEGMRPGVMERLGLGPEVVHALNPALVYGRMTGWGQDGPRALRSGHDLNYAGLSGMLFYGGLPGEIPGVPPTLLGDIGGGALYLTVGILSGVLNARTTGKGCVVDAAIVDGTSHMLSLLLSMGPMFSREARGQSLLDGPHWSRCYVCADGGHVAVQCLEPKFYAEFLEVMGLRDDPGLADQFDPKQWPVQTARLAGLFAARSRDTWTALFEGSDACVAPVLSPAEAQEDPHIAARGIWREGVPAPAPRFDGATRPTGDIALRGAHGAEILETLRQEGLI
ncbi:CaiB/BaiF CoA transferase family protein [Sagittula stellata]|uniref:CAIB/BAIF family protein n=1 Tax=Sagittula stellata (strain ATCC 700073 / DSM 11524 / E-37) TaxID=388399 RepID=A3JY37_SAGS3|nr:CaiB/BaiF CoA-transferase family protein [Sagittula stellata]EBA10423.1 CAIB/BAIF family protein [Sagittula stellata E-37]